jgi:hypothetical protein
VSGTEPFPADVKEVEVVGRVDGKLVEVRGRSAKFFVVTKIIP